jgi:hypothetical protein
MARPPRTADVDSLAGLLRQVAEAIDPAKVAAAYPHTDSSLLFALVIDRARSAGPPLRSKGGPVPRGSYPPCSSWSASSSSASRLAACPTARGDMR